MFRTTCAICVGVLNPIYKIEQMPINLSCVDSSSNYRFAPLSFSQCLECNTIQLDNLIDPKILYETSHNYTSMGKVWELYFQTMTRVIESIVDKKTVLEIGCPSGKLARKLDCYNKWYIVEPNKNESIEFNDKIVFIESFFNNDVIIHDNIDVIVHSHVFEHIYEPRHFLKKCHEILADGGEMVFGVPNMEYLTEQSLCLFAGIFFEHTIFLNKQNISYLLKENGFELIEIIDYENHSTIYRAKKTCLTHSSPIIPIIDYQSVFFDLIHRYEEFIENCNNIIQNTKKEVYIFGASYNTQILLSIGIHCHKINGILDNCMDKHRKYLYGSSLMITSPDEIVGKDCIVILKNGYYVSEIRDQLLELNPNVTILQ